MQREEAERLLVELRRRPPRLGRQGGACDRRLLRVARHEIDGDVEADDEAVEDAVVELQRPLERVVDELRAPLPDRGHAQESVAVVDDETERDLVGAQDLGPVRDEEPLGVHRRPEEMGVETCAVAGRDLLSRCDTTH